MKRANGIQSPSAAITEAMCSASPAEWAAASGDGVGSMGSAESGIVSPSATLRFGFLAAAEYSMQDRVVLVTGAARRIGAAIARTLHAAGARVVLHYRSSRADAEPPARALEAVRPDST